MGIKGSLSIILGSALVIGGIPLAFTACFASNNYRERARQVSSQIPGIVEKRELLNNGVSLVMPQITPETEERLRIHDYYKTRENYWDNLGIVGMGSMLVGICAVGLGGLFYSYSSEDTNMAKSKSSLPKQTTPFKMLYESKRFGDPQNN
jgi:hypothetical protein